jgi:cation diffusion facilitator CzcD-associated flavoprotein CzcO
MRVDYEIGIVGAGFGGIIAAVELKRAGRDSFVVFERASELGGVWRENVYPGCTCDVRSNLYSLARSPNPNWTTSYAGQPEILQYLKDVVTREGLQSHFRYGVNISELRYLEDEGCWQVFTEARPRWRVRTVILATGPHSRRSMPSIPGIDSFKGTSFHSAAWDYSIDLKGKRVAVVGTGASAIQIVPNIASSVSELFVFQRSPGWVIPRGERRVPGFERWLYQRIPTLQLLSRGAVYWLTEIAGLAFMGNSTLNRVLTRVALRKLTREVRDPETRRKLTPSYKIGCKRVLVSDDFYPAFNRSNVHLVTDRIREVVPTGLITESGASYEVDHIVYATGFIVADTDDYIRVVGREGRVLTDDWVRNGAEAYLGINVSGYPNLAMLLGPNSGLGHSSALHVMESQMNYIIQYLQTLDEFPGASLDVKPEVQTIYYADIQRRLKKTVWAAGCRSWYIDRYGRNTTVYPGVTSQYRRRTRRLRANDYLIVAPEVDREEAVDEVNLR